MRKINISVPDLLIQLESGKKIPELARHFGVSIRTVCRRLKEAGSSVKDLKISDQCLDALVSSVGEQYPLWGRRMVEGHMRSNFGLSVSVKRIQESLKRAQPILSARRSRRRLRRRVYHVPHAMSLCHIDGNHKLIRWKFVIHGMIDGYSRMFVFIKCSDNNRSQTVYDAFRASCQCYGLPDRVRGDHGGENARVAEAMQFFQSPSAFLRGTSQQNQRIERAWLDINNVTSWVKERLLALEENGQLDAELCSDLVAVHTVYTPVINRMLDEARHAWNEHKISGTRGQSPSSLYSSSLEARTSPISYPTEEDFRVFEADNPHFDPTAQGVFVEVPRMHLTTEQKLAIEGILKCYSDGEVSDYEAYIAVRELL